MLPKLLILDIDGVMTDGTKAYGIGGEVLSKSYNDLDFTAIKRFKALGVQICFLSGDTRVNENMAYRREIDFWYAPNHNKHEIMPLIKEKYGIEYNEVYYVGDDIYDILTMQMVGKSYCPANSPRVVKKYSRPLSVESGKGVIADLYDELVPFDILDDKVVGL